MKKILTGALVCLTAAGALAAAVPASARDWDHDRGRGGYGYRGHDRDGGAAVAAGIAGLAVGAALAGDRGGYYDNRYYYDAPPPGYYAGSSYYSYYDRCHSEWRWDRYARRYVRVRGCY